MLRIENVVKRFGAESSRAILNRVNLEVPAGEYIAIMGESGSGKSTLLNLIAGLDVPDEGQISVDDKMLAMLNDAARTRLRRSHMGFIFQAFHLLPHLTVAGNVGLPLALNSVDRERAEERIAALLRAVGLSAHRDRLPATLSGGEMQRVAVARALAHGPKLVLADEPTGNLDAESAHEVLMLLRDQLRRDGAGGILVTHSEAAARTADRVYRLVRGSLEPMREGRET
jgi:putative ABC transport system ATP-binding protein